MDGIKHLTFHFFCLDQTTTPLKTHGTKYFNEQIDVLFLTTKDIEFTAAYRILCNPKLEDSGKHMEQLCFGEIGRNKVALLKSLGTVTGGPQAHALCAETIQKLKPKAIIALGVCSGMKEELHHLGDVLVSSQVYFHEPSSVNSDGSTNSFCPTFDCNLGLTQLFARGRFGWYGPLQENLVPKAVHVGEVISGNTQAVNDTTYKHELRKLYSKAIGVDMQGEGMLLKYNLTILYDLDCAYKIDLQLGNLIVNCGLLKLYCKPMQRVEFPSGALIDIF